MSVLKKPMNVMNFVITQLAAIFATVLDLAIDFTVTALHVKVNISDSKNLYLEAVQFQKQCMHNYYLPADVDECVEDTHGCAQICTDTDGSYTCSCEVGYNLSEDQHGCDGKQSIT